MKNYSHSLWVSIYELFNEFFGGLLPGAFFCTYFVLCAILLTSTFTESLTAYWSVELVAIIAISYTMGALFRASNMREPDIESARHIYFHSSPTDDNAFAFVKTMSNETYMQLITDLESNDILSTALKLDYQKLRRKGRRTSRNMKNLRAKSIPYCLRKIYKTAIRRRNKLQSKMESCLRCDSQEIRHTIVELNDLITLLLPYISFSVDYPYYNLKQYFLDRKLISLANMVNWGYSTDDNKTTTRSKSRICDIKLKLRNNPNIDISLVTKSEAHIRFMNAMWYAAKNLRIISGIVSFISFFILFARAGIYFLAGEYSKEHTVLTADFNALIFPEEISDSVLFPLIKFSQTVLYYIQLIVESKFLFIIFLISIIYFWFCYIIICAIKNNFHYQRVREITYLFQTYLLMQSSEFQEMFNEDAVKGDNSF